ncbi:MAG: tRNA lysidine(34) synthetase TilS [Marinicellaceae bacterium]
MVYSKTLKLDHILSQLPESSGFLIAYSGGSDSTALLHLFSHLINTRAIHINHGINDKSDSWQLHCQQTCQSLNIPFISEKFNLPDQSENTCRKARYQSFKKHLKANEILLTAHHSGDQAETILLKLLRGTGLKGMTGMDFIGPFHHGLIARVLLEYSQSDLKQYLVKNNINWIEDESNKDNLYRRNFLRNKIIPSLENFWPNAIENIARTGQNIKNSQLLLNHYINFDAKHLTIESLKSVPESLRTTLFYHWLSLKKLPVSDKKALSQLCHDFIYSSPDKMPHYKNKHYQLMRWKQAIYCLKNYDMINPDLEFEWDTSKPFELPNQWGRLLYLEKQHMILRIKFNQLGQKLKPFNSKQTKTVKNLFQENKITTWNRHHTPFIYSNQKLISLGYEWSASDEIYSAIQIDLYDNLI